MKPRKKSMKVLLVCLAIIVAIIVKAIWVGVATYKTTAEMPEELRKAMPDVEELKKLL